jgi:hypothetical protein
VEAKRGEDERRRGVDEIVVRAESHRGKVSRVESAVDGVGGSIVGLKLKHCHEREGESALKRFPKVRLCVVESPKKSIFALCVFS